MAFASPNSSIVTTPSTRTFTLGGQVAVDGSLCVRGVERIGDSEGGDGVFRTQPGLRSHRADTLDRSSSNQLSTTTTGVCLTSPALLGSSRVTRNLRPSLVTA